MKKIVICFIGVLLICFLIPILGTIPFENREVLPVQGEEKKEEQKKEDKVLAEKYDYREYNTISLLHTKTGQIEQIPLDEYLYGVVSAEMPADFETEALKAQAVVARTYTIYTIQNNGQKHGQNVICDDSKCCQAWITKQDRMDRWEEAVRQSNWEKIVEAVNGTQGKIITYEGKPINAFFHSNSGGETEIPLNVWGGSGYPYLQVVQTAGEDAYNQYYSEVTLTKEEVLQKLLQKHPETQIDWSDINAIQILGYTDGNRVKNVKMGNITLAGVEARTLFGLKSANFKITVEEKNVKFEVIGYGHGVGMSQTGADSMAKRGSNYEQIIHHFYANVEIVNL